MTSLPVRFFAVAPLLLLASCSSQDAKEAPMADTESGSLKSHDVAEPPNIAVTAAPGVALNYDYRFALADDRIRGVQETHAAACEELGIARCRISALEYALDEEDMVNAKLSVKLDPLIARAFGSEAAKTVEKKDGKLRNLAITGEDQQPAIDYHRAQQAELIDQRNSLRQQLSAGDIKPDQRLALQQQIDDLNRQIASEKTSAAFSEDKLANTPMTFTYIGRGGLPGFRENPVRESWHLLVATVVTIIEVVLKAIAVLLPIALLLGLLVALWRTRPLRAARRWIRPASADSTD